MEDVDENKGSSRLELQTGDKLKQSLKGTWDRAYSQKGNDHPMDHFFPTVMVKPKMMFESGWATAEDVKKYIEEVVRFVKEAGNDDDWKMVKAMWAGTSENKGAEHIKRLADSLGETFPDWDPFAGLDEEGKDE